MTVAAITAASCGRPNRANVAIYAAVDDRRNKYCGAPSPSFLLRGAAVGERRSRKLVLQRSPTAVPHSRKESAAIRALFYGPQIELRFIASFAFQVNFLIFLFCL